MKMTSLEELFLEELRDLYNAENQLVKALPKIARTANNADLQAAIEEHWEETKGLVKRLEKVFKELGIKPRGKKCEAIEGMLSEGKELMEQDAEPAVMDAGIIGAAQKVEHYEMASYGTMRTRARQLGYDRAADLLQETLDEEAAADEKLTALAEEAINAEAAVGA